LPRRLVATLVALAVAFAAAFVAGPRTVASTFSGSDFGDERGLRDAVRVAFVEYWNAGERNFTPGLAKAVDYWTDYHVAKAVFAALLLIVLVALGVVVWKEFLRSGGRVLVSAGALVTVLALAALVLAMANIQGAIAPFASLLPMVPVGATDGQLADTLGQVRAHLADSQPTAPLDVMISDFARYHAAMAVIGAVVAAVVIGISVWFWKKFATMASSDWLTRRVLGSFGFLTALVSVLLIAVVVANATTAADPEPALSDFFDGGW
jgi:hypothetical protein